MNRVECRVIVVILVGLLAGCEEDERAIRIAEEAAERQAEQNQEMARLNREVAEGTKRLVEADAQNRGELVAMQRELQDEQTEIGRQRDPLETERRELATIRTRESLLVPVISHIGLLMLCCLPLLLAWYVLHGMRDGADDDAAMGELLVHDFVSDQPVLLPPSITRPPSLTHDRCASLPTDEDGDQEV
jgi:hypothetical protein